MPHVTKEFLERVIASDQVLDASIKVDLFRAPMVQVSTHKDGPLAKEAREFLAQKDKEGWVSDYPSKSMNIMSRLDCGAQSVWDGCGWRCLDCLAIWGSIGCRCSREQKQVEPLPKTGAEEAE